MEQKEIEDRKKIAQTIDELTNDIHHLSECVRQLNIYLNAHTLDGCQLGALEEAYQHFLKTIIAKGSKNFDPEIGYSGFSEVVRMMRDFGVPERTIKAMIAEG